MITMQPLRWPELETRLNDLERRVAEIESALNPYRRLGPSPESHAPDPDVVDRLVEQARAAIEAAKEK